VANRAADNVDQVRAIVTTWYRYYDGYDPMFSWWVKSPYAKLDSALTRYARTLRERVVGIPAQALAANAARNNGGPGAGAGAASRSVLRRARLGHHSAPRARRLAHGHAQPRAPESVALFPRRRSHSRRLPNPRHDGRGEVDESAREQPALLARHRVSRAEPGP